MFEATKEQEQAAAALASEHASVRVHPLHSEVQLVEADGLDEDGNVEAHYLITPGGYQVPAKILYVPDENATVQLSIQGQQRLLDLVGELRELEARPGEHPFDEGSYRPYRWTVR